MLDCQRSIGGNILCNLQLYKDKIFKAIHLHSSKLSVKGTIQTPIFVKKVFPCVTERSGNSGFHQVGTDKDVLGIPVRKWLPGNFHVRDFCCNLTFWEWSVTVSAVNFLTVKHNQTVGEKVECEICRIQDFARLWFRLPHMLNSLVWFWFIIEKFMNMIGNIWSLDCRTSIPLDHWFVMSFSLYFISPSIPTCLRWTAVRIPASSLVWRKRNWFQSVSPRGLISVLSWLPFLCYRNWKLRPTSR